MSPLHRIKIIPRSPWRTPWQADTLTGLLLATCARIHGSDILRAKLIDPMLAHSPPWVLSDAFPGDYLPMPIWLRLHDWANADPVSTMDRKALKKKRWLPLAEFQHTRMGQPPSSFTCLLGDEDLMLHHVHPHNTLSRLTDTTGSAADGFAPFARSETMLQTRQADAPGQFNPYLCNCDYLSIYFRLLDLSSADLLLDLFHELSLTGYGADTATGRGQFDILDNPQSEPDLDSPSPNANALLSLSTFQPGPNDPTDGLWESFPKFGKLGPELASLAGDPRKNTLLMLKPGACFRCHPADYRYLGRAVPMQQLLSSQAAQALMQRNIHLIHPAFALIVPCQNPLWN